MRKIHTAVKQTVDCWLVVAKTEQSWEAKVQASAESHLQKQAVGAAELQGWPKHNLKQAFALRMHCNRAHVLMD